MDATKIVCRTVLFRAIDPVLNDPMTAIGMRSRIWEALTDPSGNPVLVAIQRLDTLSPEAAYYWLALTVSRARVQAEANGRKIGSVAIATEHRQVFDAIHVAMRDVEEAVRGILVRSWDPPIELTDTRMIGYHLSRPNRIDEEHALVEALRSISTNSEGRP